MSRFADTSYFLALLIPNDEHHDSALRLTDGWRGNLVTTDFVLIEVANHLSPQTSRGVFQRFIAAVSQDPRMRVIPATRDLFRRGSDLYGARLDKNWSLTDCISFEVMRDLRLVEALTGDHHFEQAGFTALLT